MEFVMHQASARIPALAPHVTMHAPANDEVHDELEGFDLVGQWERARSDPPSHNGDRWARLIIGWSSVSQGLGLIAYRARQNGDDFDEFVAKALATFEFYGIGQ